MRLALFQPEQAGNVGAILRLGACLSVPVDIIEPCGFPFGDRALARAGMDYIERASCVRHANWATYDEQREGRLILLSTQGITRLDAIAFEADDNLLFGSESRGVSPEVRDAADRCVRIPQAQGTRSLNVALASAIVLGEALKQLGGFPA